MISQVKKLEMLYFGMQGMRSDFRETRQIVRQLASKIEQSTSLID